MKLHAHRWGDAGPPLCLLHGWGMHGGVWRDLGESLATRCRVTAPDLPGHGRSPLAGTGAFTLDGATTAVAAGLAEPAIVAGWSLGGLVAIDLALRHPERVRHLVLVAATPRFVAGDDWTCAMDPGVLESFARELFDDPAATLRRFLALQVLGSDDGRRTLARLKAELDASPLPQREALAGGLAVLKETSLLGRLHSLAMPVTIIQGARDTLVPLAAAGETAAHIPGAVLEIVHGAGHAAFLSHPGEFRRSIEAVIGT